MSDLQRNLLVAAQAGFEISERPDLGSLVHWRGNTALPIHRWYKYREGYSPELIEKLNLGEKILDPFAGSGSIMVGAAQLDRESVGIDVSPLAAFITKVKVTPLDDLQVGAIRKFIEQPNTLLVSDPWPAPALKIAHKMFEPDILETLLRIRRAIEAWTEDQDVHDFLLLAWISILESVGSYFKEGNGIKYRNKKREAVGYSVRIDGVWQLERFGEDQKAFTLQSFTRHLGHMLKDAESVWVGQPAWKRQVIHTGSATEIMPGLPDQAFDSVIFSPPYANRFDYFEATKVEMWFGGFVKSYADLNTLRKQSMRSHLGSALGDTDYVNDDLESLISLMDQDSYAAKSRVPSLLRGYFEDMKSVLTQCRRVTKAGSRTYVVVGNSAYAGVIMPTDSLCAQVALASGFKNAKLHVVRHLTVAPQQRDQLRGYESFMRESVVELW